jgi:hypothetical protein
MNAAHLPPTSAKGSSSRFLIFYTSGIYDRYTWCRPLLFVIYCLIETPWSYLTCHSSSRPADQRKIMMDQRVSRSAKKDHLVEYKTWQAGSTRSWGGILYWSVVCAGIDRPGCTLRATDDRLYIHTAKQKHTGQRKGTRQRCAWRQLHTLSVSRRLVGFVEIWMYLDPI